MMQNANFKFSHFIGNAFIASKATTHLTFEPKGYREPEWYEINFAVATRSKGSRALPHWKSQCWWCVSLMKIVINENRKLIADVIIMRQNRLELSCMGGGGGTPPRASQKEGVRDDERRRDDASAWGLWWECVVGCGVGCGAQFEQICIRS
jgi:hypothetical protein